eukprot:TCALIF_12654-PA protein Name:"Similar to Ama Protein amalgam (Drosophila melanogaster)" AED:0.21 eAED:0.21 QI:0/0/0/0.42/0.5/0.57/7/0/498
MRFVPVGELIYGALKTPKVRPEVVSIPESGLIVAQTGESVTLACQVTKGNPQPEVKWHRRERKMPSGEEFIRGLSFTYTSVSRHHSGNYICSADNGFGEPSETTLKLDVQPKRFEPLSRIDMNGFRFCEGGLLITETGLGSLDSLTEVFNRFPSISDAPEIDQDETFIHTGEGYETEIVCVIHSSPRAEVSWLKDGFPIDSSATNEITHRGNRHTLLLRDVKEESFGDYTCQAKNLHGEAEKTTRVSDLLVGHHRGAVSGKRRGSVYMACQYLVFSVETRERSSSPLFICSSVNVHQVNRNPAKLNHSTRMETGYHSVYHFHHIHGLSTPRSCNKRRLEEMVEAISNDLYLGRFHFAGKANDVNFKSDPKGPNYDQYALEWTAQSSTPITHFKVQYKAETDVQWTEAEIEAVNVDREFYAGGYTLPQLRPATVYMTRVASQNSYGYNDYGEIFKFATKGADPVQKPMTAGALSLVDRQPFRVVLITLVSVIFAHLSSR